LGQQAYDLAKQSYYTATNWVLTNPQKVDETLNVLTGQIEGLPFLQTPTRSDYVGFGLSLLLHPGETIDTVKENSSAIQQLFTPATPTFNPPATNTSDVNAAGGFLIYPNKPNTNMMQSVYKK